MWKLSRMKGSVELLSTMMDDWLLCLSTMSSFEFNFHSFKLRLSLDPDLIHISIKKVLFNWSTKNPYSNFRINNCFCQIPLRSVFEVLFNEFVFRTRGSLLIFFQSCSRHQKYVTTEAECRVPYNKQLTNRACSSRTATISGQYSPERPRARLVSG